jgi:hypothetical protein
LEFLVSAETRTKKAKRLSQTWGVNFGIGMGEIMGTIFKPLRNPSESTFKNVKENFLILRVALDNSLHLDIEA